MSVSVLNTTESLTGKTLLKAEDSQTITGSKTFDLGASAPFVVVSGAAKVANLDADKLDGQTGTYYTNASNIDSGTVPTARLGSGTANSASVLRGDQTWAVLTAEQVYASTGAQNDVAPDAGEIVQILCTGAAPVITGFSGGAAGRQLLLVCKGTTLKVSHQTGSSAANQITCESTAGQIVGVNGMILLTYDATNSKWLAACLDPGAPVSVTFSAGDYTGNGLMTWTVASGDVEVHRFKQRGRDVRYEIMVFTSTVGGTPDTTLRVAIAGGFVPSVNASGRSAFVAAYVSDNGTEQLGRTNFSATHIEFVRVPSAAWSAAADTTRVSFNGNITID